MIYRLPFLRKSYKVNPSFTIQVGNFRLYIGEEVVALLEEAGFTQARYKTMPIRQRTEICVLAEKAGGEI